MESVNKTRKDVNQEVGKLLTQKYVELEKLLTQKDEVEKMLTQKDVDLEVKGYISRKDVYLEVENLLTRKYVNQDINPKEDKDLKITN